MFVTKRKFHNLLNSFSSSTPIDISPKRRPLTAPSTTAPSTATAETATADPGSLFKRRRVSGPYTALLEVQARHKRNTIQPPPLPDDQDGDEEDDLPNYRPWDRSQFLQRLQTFKHVDKWSLKPNKVNEVQWAKRGWSCVGPERVACVGGCGQEVCVKLDDIDDDVENYEERALRAAIATGKLPMSPCC